MTPNLNKLDQTNDAVKLISAGARTNLILHFCPSISKGTISRLTHEITGSKPKSGVMPCVTDQFFDYYPGLHIMRLLEYFDKHAELSPVDRFLAAFDDYVDICQLKDLDPRFNLERFFLLLRSINSGYLDTSNCKKCKAKMLKNREYCARCAPPRNTPLMDL